MKKMLVIGWDAADWKVINPLLDRGEMPALAGLIGRGVIADLETLQPPLSPMLWTSIATGKRADQHGILGFTEVDPATGALRPSTSTSRRTKALWNILNQNGARTHLIGWLGSHPAEPIHGINVSETFIHPTAAPGDEWPLLPGTIHPRRLEGVLGELRVSPDEVDADLLRSFVPRAAEVDQEHDRRLAVLATDLAETLSIQSAATWALEHEPWDFAGVYFLALDHFSHAFMEYRAPRQAHVSERDFALYGEVVNVAYRLHDMMLARLLELAGPDCHVMLLSDHGFHSDHLRPRFVPQIPSGPTIWHRPHGVLCLAGPGIRQDERIYGAGLLDIAPTILSLYGLPVGQDMEGRVLAEAFEQPPAVETIPSWDAVEGDSGRHESPATLNEAENAALLEQFIALGYIDRPDQNLDQAARDCVLEQNWNLARVLLEKQQWREAYRLLETVHEQMPRRTDVAILLAQSQLRLGLLDQAEQTIGTVEKRIGRTPVVAFIQGNIALERGHDSAALELLREAERADGSLPALPIQVGFACLRQRLGAEAGHAFARGAKLDPHDPLAPLGEAMVALRERRYDTAMDKALHAIGLRYQLPRAHYLLGTALAALGLHERAAQAFETTLVFPSAPWRAHGWLAWLYGRKLGRPDEAARHRELWRTGEERRRKTHATLAEIRREAIDRLPPLFVVQPPTEAEPATKEPLLLVSGLPRSGTSLMMQMLQAGGFTVLTDKTRAADEDNPEGYLEWEAIKTVGRHPEILQQAEGKVIKVVSLLLPALPKDRAYRVIFLDRPVEEVIRSQAHMMRRREARPPQDARDAARRMETHRSTVLQALEASPQFEVLRVDYPSLVADPASWIERIRAFVGPDRLPHAEAMCAKVKPELYRNRF